MSYANHKRLRNLEAEIIALNDLYEQMTPSELKALLDRWVYALIQAELVQAPDPAHPRASIESLRHTHRVELEELRQEVLSPLWQELNSTQARRLFYTIMREMGGR